MEKHINTMNERNPEVKGLNPDEYVAHRRNPKHAPAQACYAAVGKAHSVYVSPHEKVGNLTYGDIEALCGTAAAERLTLSRKTTSKAEPARFDCESEIRDNLARLLLKKGMRLTCEDVEAIERGDYDGLKESARRVPFALEDIILAERYEAMIRGKRERQINRGARAYQEDETRDKLASAAAVAYAVALVTKTVVAVKKIIKG